MPFGNQLKNSQHPKWVCLKIREPRNSKKQFTRGLVASTTPNLTVHPVTCFLPNSFFGHLKNVGSQVTNSSKELFVTHEQPHLKNQESAKKLVHLTTALIFGLMTIPYYDAKFGNHIVKAPM